jgi:hypothetical protein
MAMELPVMTEHTAKGRDLRRGERLQIMLDADELNALDDFRFSHRMPSRAAAVRELLRRGLEGEGFEVEHRGTSSGSYGVLTSSPGDRNNRTDGTA